MAAALSPAGFAGVGGVRMTRAGEYGTLAAAAAARVEPHAQVCAAS